MCKKHFFAAGAAYVMALLACTSLLVAGDLVEVGRVAIPGRASMHLHVDGNYVYVVRRGFPSGPETFSIVNVTDKTAPWIEGKINDLPYFHNAFDLCYNNGFAYTAHRYGGVTMIDVSNRASPFVKSTAPSTYTHFGIMSVGNYLYVADHSAGSRPGGMRIFDVSGNNLVQVGAVLGGIDGRDLVIASDGLYAYQSSGKDDWGTARLYTYDIANKSSPSVLSSIPNIFGHKLLISTDNRYLYMSYSEPDDFTPPSKGVKIYDLSNRAQPAELRNLALINADHLALDYARKILYVRVYNDPNYPSTPGIHVFDISDPSNPTELYYLSGTEYSELFYYQDYLYAEEYKYFGPENEKDDLVIFKAYVPNLPPLANAGTDQTIEATSPAGTEVTLDGSGSSDPDNDPLTYTWRENGSVIATDQTCEIMLALGSHTIELTVNDGKGGVDTDEVIITVKEGLQMFALYAGKYLEIRECDGSEGWIGANGEIKVLTGTPSMMAIDLRAIGDVTIYRDNTIDGDVISNAAVHLDSRSTVTGAVVENAGREPIPLPAPSFIAGGNNVSVPKKGALTLAPGSYGKVTLSKMAKLYLRSGQYNFTSLYMDQDSDILMDLSGGLLQVNIVGGMTAGDDALIAIAPANSGTTRDIQFTVLKSGIVSLGNSVTFMGTLVAPYAHVKTSSELKLKGAIYADSITGIKRAVFLHHSSPQSLPKWTGPAAEKLASVPQELVLLQNYPNPFLSEAKSRFAGNPETEIRFALPKASHVVLAIYDITGREIRKLAEAQFQAGYHGIRWDGKDKNGNPVPSGVYLYRLQAGSFSQVRKMSLVR
jgi:hypothetical protein